MVNNISGFGLRVTIHASTTFPQTIGVTQFADDSDPLDIPSQQLADKAMGLNGDLVTWSTPNPILGTLNVIPGSNDDLNLQILANANRVAKGKASNRDIITMVLSYPDGRVATLTNGVITDGMLGNSVASAGRLKSKAYAFAFENVAWA